MPKSDDHFPYVRSSDKDLAVIKNEVHNFRQQYHRDEEKREEEIKEIKTDLKGIRRQITYWQGALTVLILISPAIWALFLFAFRSVASE